MNSTNLKPVTKVGIEEIADNNGGRLTVLRLVGDISLDSEELLMESYEKASKGQPILLDFTKSDYINSSGIALLIQIMMKAEKSGQKVAVFGLTPHFNKIFTMVGIPKYARLYKDQPTAIASLA